MKIALKITLQGSVVPKVVKSSEVISIKCLNLMDESTCYDNKNSKTIIIQAIFNGFQGEEGQRVTFHRIQPTIFCTNGPERQYVELMSQAQAA